MDNDGQIFNVLVDIYTQLKRAQDWREAQAAPHIRDRCIILVRSDIGSKRIKHYECVPASVLALGLLGSYRGLRGKGRTIAKAVASYNKYFDFEKGGE